MGPKGLPSGQQQQPVQQQRQQQQQHLPPGRVSLTKPTADTTDALSNASGDEDVPLPLVDQKYLSDRKFVEFSISLNSKRALAEVLKYERCSLVQAAAIPVCLGPEDVIAKAKTGTGKTLAFIIPIIEKVLARRAPPGKVSALVLSPTRELARQIQTETHKMLTFHPGLHSMVVYGGVDVKKNLRALNQRMPDILIATPGRCWDIMTQSHNPALNSLLDSTRVLTLDEADNLLDMGFRPQISKILSGLPPTAQRQTFLFSATFPEDVKSLADVALKRKHRYIDAIGEDVATPSHVQASSLVVPLSWGELQLQLLGLIAAHIAQEPDYKIIVFLPTANLTAFFAEAFAVAGLRGVLEIHSRKSQAQRDRASAQFRSESRLVMFSSDVSARGVDYPNVTYVIQLGAPANREQYIHRAGRTGRAGRAGQGTLLLAEFERDFLDWLRDVPITPLQPLQLPLPSVLATGGGGLGGSSAAACPLSDALLRDPVSVLGRVADQIDYASRARAYQSFLGYYKSHEVLKFRPEQVVALANQYAAVVLGCPSPPGLLAKTVGKMGLKGVPGLVLVKEGQQGQPPPASAVPVGPLPTADQAVAAAAAAMAQRGGVSTSHKPQQHQQQGVQSGGTAAAAGAVGVSAGMRAGRANGAQQQSLQLGPGPYASSGSGPSAQGVENQSQAQPQARQPAQQGAPGGGRTGEIQSLPRAPAQTPALPQFQPQQRIQAGRGQTAVPSTQAPQQQQQVSASGPTAARVGRTGGRQAAVGPTVPQQQQSADCAGPTLPPGLGPPNRSEPVIVAGFAAIAAPPADAVLTGSNAVKGTAPAFVSEPAAAVLPSWNPQAVAAAAAAAPNNTGVSGVLRQDGGLQPGAVPPQQQQQLVMPQQPVLQPPQQQMLQLQQQSDFALQRQCGAGLAGARDGQLGGPADGTAQQQPLQLQQHQQLQLQQYQQMQLQQHQQMQMQHPQPQLFQQQQHFFQQQQQHGGGGGAQSTDPADASAAAAAMAAAAAAISGQSYQGGLPPGAQGTSPGAHPPGGSQQGVSAEYAMLAAMLNMPPPYGFIHAQQQQQVHALQHIQAQAQAQAQVPQSLQQQQQHNDVGRQLPPNPVSQAPPHTLQAQVQQHIPSQQQQAQQQQVLQFAHAQAAAMAGLGSLQGGSQIPGAVDGPRGGESGAPASGQSITAAGPYQYRQVQQGPGPQALVQDGQEVLSSAGGSSLEPSAALLQNLANLGMQSIPQEAAATAVAAAVRRGEGMLPSVGQPSQHLQQTHQQQMLLQQQQAQQQRATQQQQLQQRQQAQQQQLQVQQQMMQQHAQQLQQTQQQQQQRIQQQKQQHVANVGGPNVHGAGPGNAPAGRQQQGPLLSQSQSPVLGLRQQQQQPAGPGGPTGPMGQQGTKAHQAGGPRGGPQGGPTAAGRTGGVAAGASAPGPAAAQGPGGAAPTRWWHKPQLKEQAAEITERVAAVNGLATGGDTSLKQARQQQQPALGMGVNGPAPAGRAVQQQPQQQQQLLLQQQPQQQQLLQAGRNAAAISGGGGTGAGAAATSMSMNGGRGQGPSAAMAAAAAAAAAEHAQAHVKAQQQMQQQAQAFSLQQVLMQQQQAQQQQQQILLQQQMLQYGGMGHQAPYFLVGQAPLATVAPQSTAVYASAQQQQQQLTPVQQQHLQQQLTPMQLQQLQHLAPAQQQWYMHQLALGGGAAPECKQQ